MGGRAKGKKRVTVSRADSIRALALATIVTSVPILGTIFVTASTSAPDLSERTPINGRLGNYVVLNWSALRQHQLDVPDARLGIAGGTQIQALGYMLDGGRPIATGEWVQEFVLLPEAGNLLHHAHRIRDQMITVSLEQGSRIQFSPRALVWVWGALRVSSEPTALSEPLYMLERARAKLAVKSDIQKYFR